MHKSIGFLLPNVVRFLIACLSIGGFSAVALAQSNTVLVITVDGTINPASADYIRSGIERAVDQQAECLIVRLNTPGGLLKSTRVIVSDLLGSKVPTVVYVSPSGAHAGSAGVFVTLAAHVAAMAPGTNIGAAHPVGLGGEQPDSIMAEKATNDAAAFIRTISEKRHRNVQWAEDAVRKSLSITENEAVKEGIIDLVASSIPELLEQIDGKVVEVATGAHVLHTRGASIATLDKTFQQQLLDILSDPNIAYILMMIGFYGLLFELYNPGAIFPGVVGVISIILAFYSLHTLPVNWAGVTLILFAIVLFVLEIKIISHGLLTVGGVLSLALGSVMLIRTDSVLDFVSLSWEVIVFVVVLTSAFFLFAIGAGVRAQRRKPTTGPQGIVGEKGIAMTDLKPSGQVRVHGEIWTATSVAGNLKKGAVVRVVDIENLKLTVRKAEE
jgi:membrane-bound serine protease (ClpP class)